ncbi:MULTISPECIES: TspO/MBR family protein [unclassified Methylobacterium]|uniref:TspO/MBR family protein n=1 Tax=unclassified Methylobacterium TaxID=2615210 RepID=UPI00037672B5|nr:MULTISPECIES: TspO/MBR family protein [unclassified Methylobacterium]KQP39408.1 TspO protein [Methylobacterium sp. Leaf106]
MIGGFETGPVVTAAAAALVTALAGGLLTTTGPWYQSLRRPSWKPPDWAFGPVWTTIFTLTAISAVIAWHAEAGTSARGALLATYGVNLVLNIAWSGIFFRLRRPDWAYLEVIALWLSIVALIAVTAQVSGIAALLLAPYLAWVSVATLLNRAIVRLNGPFGEARSARSIGSRA